MTDVVLKQIDDQPLRCLVVDDEWVAVKGIVNHIHKLNFLQVTDTCSSAMEAAEVLKRKEIDVLFLDINMPYLSGLDFLESLDKAPLTILTTAYSEYALEAFRLNVVDYLLKPIAFQRFFQAALKVQDVFRSQVLVQRSETGASLGLYIRQGTSFVRIEWGDILYVESMQNYLKLYFDAQTLIIHQTMTSLEEVLPKDAFFRVHRSYLVNVSRIDSISGGRVFVRGRELPVSAKRKEELLDSVVYKNLISR